MSVAAFKKLFGSPDPGGVKDFSGRVGNKAVLLRSGAEQGLPWNELADEERALIAVLKLPRRLKDIEASGLLPGERALQLVRALHGAELLDTVDADKARALVPVEVRKALAEQKGQEMVRKKLVAQIYRPGAEDSAAGSAPPSQSRNNVVSAAPSASRNAVVPTPPPVAPSASRNAVVPTPPPVAPSASRNAVVSTPPPVASSASRNATTGAPAAAPGAELATIAAEADAASVGLNSKDNFAVLGLERSATEDKVKAAYLQMVRRWHPDRLAGHSGPEAERVRNLMKALFARASEANSVLSDKTSRQAYLESIARRERSGTSAATLRNPARAQDARMHAQMGRVFAQKKDYAAAQKEYRVAIGMDPEMLEYRVELGWIQSLNPANGADAVRRQAALQMIREAVGDAKYADGHYKMGLLYRTLGELDQAEKAFKKAAAIDPRHADAASEVRLMAMRGEKQRQAAGQGPQRDASLMDRLKGKKP